MAKRRYGMDSAKIAKWHKEGRGQGIGAEYTTTHQLSITSSCLIALKTDPMPWGCRQRFVLSGVNSDVHA